jgi:hypothetical protein
LNRSAIDFQENVAQLNPGMFCGPVLRDQLGLYDSLAVQNPGAAILWSNPFPLLLDVEPTKDKKSYGGQRNENKSEGNAFPVIRNGY